MMKGKPFYITLIILFIAVIGYTLYFFYDRLGGFEKVEVFELKGENVVIIGQEFYGKQTSPDIESFFEDARKLISNNLVKGELCIVDYQSDTIPDNFLHMYIGVLLSQEMAEVPNGFEVREIESDKRFAVFLSMHPIVRPSPSRIRNLFNEAASKKGVTLEPFTLEKHYPDNTMSIEAWTQ